MTSDVIHTSLTSLLPTTHPSHQQVSAPKSVPGNAPTVNDDLTPNAYSRSELNRSVRSVAGHAPVGERSAAMAIRHHAQSARRARESRCNVLTGILLRPYPRRNPRPASELKNEVPGSGVQV